MAMELVEFQTLCSLALGETQLMTGHLEAAHALAEGALAHARRAPGTWSPGVCPVPAR